MSGERGTHVAPAGHGVDHAVRQHRSDQIHHPQHHRGRLLWWFQHDGVADGQCRSDLPAVWMGAS